MGGKVTDGVLWMDGVTRVMFEGTNPDPEEDDDWIENDDDDGREEDDDWEDGDGEDWDNRGGGTEGLTFQTPLLASILDSYAWMSLITEQQICPGSGQ